MADCISQLAMLEPTPFGCIVFVATVQTKHMYTFIYRERYTYVAPPRHGRYQHHFHKLTAMDARVQEIAFYVYMYIYIYNNSYWITSHHKLNESFLKYRIDLWISWSVCLELLMTTTPVVMVVIYIYIYIYECTITWYCLFYSDMTTMYWFRKWWNTALWMYIRDLCWCVWSCMGICLW